MSITKLDQLFEVLKSKPKKRLVAAYANDAHTIEAVNDAVEKGIVDALLVGDEAVMRNVCREHGFDESKFRMVHEPNESKAAFKAVQLINEGSLLAHFYRIQ